MIVTIGVVVVLFWLKTPGLVMTGVGRNGEKGWGGVGLSGEGYVEGVGDSLGGGKQCLNE